MFAHLKAAHVKPLSCHKRVDRKVVVVSETTVVMIVEVVLNDSVVLASRGVAVDIKEMVEVDCAT